MRETLDRQRSSSTSRVVPGTVRLGYCYCAQGSRFIQLLYGLLALLVVLQRATTNQRATSDMSRVSHLALTLRVSVIAPAGVHRRPLSAEAEPETRPGNSGTRDAGTGSGISAMMGVCGCCVQCINK